MCGGGGGGVCACVCACVYVRAWKEWVRGWGAAALRQSQQKPEKPTHVDVCSSVFCMCGRVYMNLYIPS